MRDPTKSPFPGLDPYLEQSWPDVHHALCTYARDAIRPQLPPGLIPRLDERTFIEDSTDYKRVVIPDVRVVDFGSKANLPWNTPDEGGVAVATEPIILNIEVVPYSEGFIRVVDTRNGSRVITVIEFASPANKTWEDGRSKYQKKQKELVNAGVNLVEVDLLRAGEWNSYPPADRVPKARRRPYHVCVTRANRREWPEAYLFGLSEPLPVVKIPLRETDADILLDLRSLMAQVYVNGSYGYDLDYSQPPQPPVVGDDAAWMKQWLEKVLGSGP